LRLISCRCQTGGVVETLGILSFDLIDVCMYSLDCMVPNCGMVKSVYLDSTLFLAYSDSLDFLVKLNFGEKSKHFMKLDISN
jgi:hypothetical protein